MAILHVQQIRGFLQKNFSGLIDISDYGSAPADQKVNVFLTRTLAAFALMHLTDIAPDRAAATVTDGTGDNGIDAVYFDESDRRLYLVQSKWSGDGHGSIERGDLQKFITGFHDVVNTRFERFNEKVRGKQSEIERAVFDGGTKIVVVLAYTGQEPLASECERDLQDLLDEMNDPTEMVERRVLRQGTLHAIVAAGARGAPINLEVVLTEWGQVKEPYYAIYGQIAATDVAAWGDAHHPRLFAPNLRNFLGPTDVNEGMIETLKTQPERLKTQPERFWYFNNGITALCASIKKKPIGGTSRDTGIFECDDVTVVNGAQTVGALAAAKASDHDVLSQARVFIRFISLENTPSDIATAITRFTNTQNRIEPRDFAALDPQQERIRTELQIDNIEYAYKSGQTVPTGRLGFDFVEAAVALACASSDVGLAVQAKREIGKLWEDIEKVPYKILFNPSVSGPALWKRVCVLRLIDKTLQAEQKEREGRDRMHVVHGNRLVAWLVYQTLCDTATLDQEIDSSTAQSTIEGITVKSLNEIANTTNELFGTDVYLASLFKNLTKCREIVKEIRQE